MTSQYLVVELAFLVPLMAAAATAVLRRRTPEELRFFRTAAAVSVLLIIVNAMLIPSGYLFPASVVFLLMVTAYAVHPSTAAACVAALIAVAGVLTAAQAASDYADAHIGSFADRNHSVFTAAAGLLGGLSTVIVVQLVLKAASRRNSPANDA